MSANANPKIIARRSIPSSFEGFATMQWAGHPPLLLRVQGTSTLFTLSGSGAPSMSDTDKPQVVLTGSGQYYLRFERLAGD